MISDLLILRCVGASKVKLFFILFTEPLLSAESFIFVRLLGLNFRNAFVSLFLERISDFLEYLSFEHILTIQSFGQWAW
ncbi:CLUMA_CG010654, isoform A [Clunio marinus]|uniref:CLUMA_CG010654, isoform A n=1 Tax=Clunio marinus TaxID=568069 RepID=A0A1J1IBY4_9DIPT|nr:CLUMA_CG010654, isoform A [Clunio marinus]